MKRRFHDDHFSNDDLDDDDDFDDDEISDWYVLEEDYELIKLEIKKEMLEKSIEMAKKSTLFWKFRKPATQLKIIKDLYSSLMELLEIEKLQNKK